MIGLRCRMGEAPERGDVALNAVIIVPALLLVGLLAIMGGRIALARGAVQTAANEGARAASISRSAGIAKAQARSTATTTLTNSGVLCTRTSVTTDTSAFALPLGTTGPVTVDVTCVVPLSDLGLPGAPGDITLTSTAGSVIDAYRERT